MSKKNHGVITLSPHSGDGINSLIEETARRDPNSVALIDSERNQYTYAELIKAAESVAAMLRAAGVKIGDFVAVSAGRTCEMAIGILGILIAGAAYVPLDPEYPKKRLKDMLRDVGANVLLTESKYAEEFSHKGLKIVILDPQNRAAPAQSDGKPHEQVDADDAAYVIYTSGTTGTPKGVVVTHRNLLNYVAALPAALGLDSYDRYLHSASISFSSSVRQLIVPLSIGGTVVIASSEELRDPKSLFEFIAEQKVTILDFVPSYWRSCIEAVSSDAISRTDVRMALSASEPLHNAIAERVISMLGPGAKMFNMYGQTETTGIISVFPLAGGTVETAIVPVGYPVANSITYVLDDDLFEIGKGKAGELYVGGAGLARGYLNRPELTAERFVADPFSDVEGARLYRTGDLARYSPNGEIEYIGRVDNRVKIRGFRVEPGEIESVIARYEDVREAVVLAIDDNTAWADKRLVAFVVSKTHSTINTADLRKHLKDILPEYMVPAAYVQLEQMPLTANGKLDRKALPIPERDRSGASEGYEAPRNETEVKLAEIWSKVLGVDDIGIHDNFFDLGGHSLLAIRMFSVIEETFHKSVPLATLFEAGTIEKLASVLNQQNWQEPESSLVPIQPNGSKPPLYSVHAAGGNVLFYRDLAERLGNDQPLYGLQARRIGGRQVGHATVEEMAAFYISQIKALQPEGPYYICGSSFGGLAALEMAQQLNAGGDVVAFLGFFDTNSPDHSASLEKNATLTMKLLSGILRFEHHYKTVRAIPAGDRITYIRVRLQKARVRTRRFFVRNYRKSARWFDKKFDSNLRSSPRYIQIEDGIRKAGMRYVPKPYSGKITLFRASRQMWGVVPDPTLGWSRIPNELEIHEVPGNHGSLVTEPYVSGLVKALRECLDIACAEEQQLTEARSSPSLEGIYSRRNAGPASVS